MYVDLLLVLTHGKLTTVNCADMEVAGRHRGRASGIQIMKTCELEAKDCKREQTMMYLN
eukprot:COSAG05_NODE_10608_length_556_cov_0.746171_2_plen_58_part_01